MNRGTGAGLKGAIRGFGGDSDRAVNVVVLGEGKERSSKLSYGEPYAAVMPDGRGSSTVVYCVEGNEEGG